MSFDGEEETVDNIASFIEATKPSEKKSSDTLELEVRNTVKESIMPQTTPNHSIVLSKSNLSKTKISGLSGISFSKVGSDISSSSAPTPAPSIPKTFSKHPMTTSKQSSFKLPSGISIQKQTVSSEENKRSQEKETLPKRSNISLEKPNNLTSMDSLEIMKDSDDNHDQMKMKKFSNEKPEEKTEIKNVNTVELSSASATNTLSVSQLASLVDRLNTDPDLNILVLRHMTSDSVRNLCDMVAVLQMSGETETSDTETMSLYYTMVNISSLDSKLDALQTEQYQPLTNLCCMSSHFSNLSKLIMKEPNLKGFISKKIGESELSKYERFVSDLEKTSATFLNSHIEYGVILYHQFRNVALQYVLNKLKNVYGKMKPMFDALHNPDEEFNVSVARLEKLVNADWAEAVTVSEETSFDFNFLITIMKNVKNPKESRISPPVQKETSLDKSNNPTQHAPMQEEIVSNKVEKSDVRKYKKAQVKKRVAKEEASEKAIKNHNSSFVSVDSLYVLKDLLEAEEEQRNRVIAGVGEEAFIQFCNYVPTLTEKNVVIEDINIRTLYFTILNFSKIPKSLELSKYEPLSNFALRIQPFSDMRNLFKKDEQVYVDIRSLVNDSLDEGELDTFEKEVDHHLNARNDFVLENQEDFIMKYHRIRNVLIDSVMSRLKILHSNIQTIDTAAVPDIFSDSLKMLKSLMDTHFFGQVLMMERIQFNFDFVVAILKHLQTLGAEGTSLKNIDSMKRLDPLKNVYLDLRKDISDPEILRRIEIIIPQKIVRAYVNTINNIKETSNMSLVQKRSFFCLKNATHLVKVNFNCPDMPLTNISLELSKIVSLVKFITNDSGIKNYVVSKHGEVALRELQALEKAHCERNEEFVTKFVEKNLQLYHSLRNSALEKILKQITLVHGKVKNSQDVGLDDPDYQAAVQRVEDIVTSDSFTRMISVEDHKFDFGFLTKILVVWKTKQSEDRKAEEAIKAAEARKALEAKKIEDQRREEESRKAEAVRKSEVIRRVEVSSLNTEHPIVIIDDSNEPEPEPRKAAEPFRVVNVGKVNIPRSRTMSANAWKPVATVTPMQSRGDYSLHQRQVPAAPGKVATKDNRMLVNNGEGELPIRTKCNHCNGRSSEKISEYMQHYSLSHFRSEIEKHIKTPDNKCPCCKEPFSNRNELIQHMGLVHNFVKLVLTKTERWICHMCKKEFQNEDFLKKHWIKTHLEKRFEVSFLAYNEKNETICQFCEKTFEHTKVLFCHIGIDHGKLDEMMPTLKNDEDVIKCRHCDLETGAEALKQHYIQTHYSQTFIKQCQDQKLINDDLSCKFCFITFNDSSVLLEHLGIEHNLILGLISNFTARKMEVEINKDVKTISNIQGKKPTDKDPLETETEFVDTVMKSPVNATPIKIGSVKSTHTKESQIKSVAVPRSVLKSVQKKQQHVRPFKLPNHKAIQEYSTFCSKNTTDEDFGQVNKSNFATFKSSVFEKFLEHTWTEKRSIEDIDETLGLFAGVYPKENVLQLPFIPKFQALKEYCSFCERLKTTPGDCNPMQTVIFLSQVMAKPDIRNEDIEWIVLMINAVHNKVNGKELVHDKQIRGFCEAVGANLPEEANEEPQNLTETSITDEADQNNVDEEEMQVEETKVEEQSIKEEKTIEELEKVVTLSEEPECIDLDDEDDDVAYKFVCEECDDCLDRDCDHTTHPRIPLPYDVSAHYKSTGHVSVRPLDNMLKMKPMMDLSYSFQFGATVRKQWREMVLQRSHIPPQFVGSNKCKWKGCEARFEDAVDAFKHIMDKHLKSKQGEKRKSDAANNQSEKRCRI